MPRPWTCRGCKKRHPSRTKQRCECGRKRPTSRKPAHLVALEIPYEQYVVLNGGERCGVATCGRGSTPKRRLDRDHDHRTGLPRGLLCPTHNRMLGNRVTAAELRAMADYLDRAALSHLRAVA